MPQPLPFMHQSKRHFLSFAHNISTACSSTTNPNTIRFQSAFISQRLTNITKANYHENRNKPYSYFTQIKAFSSTRRNFRKVKPENKIERIKKRGVWNFPPPPDPTMKKKKLATSSNSKLFAKIENAPQHSKSEMVSPKIGNLPLPETVKQNLTGLGIKSLTEIQRAAFLPLLRGKSFVGRAKTGIGFFLIHFRFLTTNRF